MPCQPDRELQVERVTDLESRAYGRPVIEEARVGGVVQGDDTGLVRQDLANAGRTLEPRPVSIDRCVELERPTIHQQERTDRGEGLGDRVRHGDAVPFPRFVALRIAVPAPDIDDPPSSVPDSQGRTRASLRSDDIGERLPDGLEVGLGMSVDVHSGNDAHRPSGDCGA